MFCTTILYLFPFPSFKMTLGVFQKIIKQASIQNNRKEQMFLFRDPFIMSVDLEVRVKFYKNKKKDEEFDKIRASDCTCTL